MERQASMSPGSARDKETQRTTAESSVKASDSRDVAEQKRLSDAREAGIPWKLWGPYLSERQWGTVREDYSDNGHAWDYFNHDQARSRAYRWGEDGLGGICDDGQRLCFALALWNERDAILKERLFGLSNGEGNHGEDVKEYYFYLDSTPTHSYMKYLYKYPQRSFPYTDLVHTNRQRSRHEFEYELLDTGVFDDDRYFDVFLEYAKAGPDDILIRVTVANRGPEAARLHVLPTLWFRNTWSWGNAGPKPTVSVEKGAIRASHPDLGDYMLSCDGAPELLFTENESNVERLWGRPNGTPWVKDSFHRYVIAGDSDAVNPAKTGTKAAVRYILDVPAGGTSVIRLRLSANAPAEPFGKGFDTIVSARLADADAFYDRITSGTLSEDQRRVYRQALAGMLWSKQYYLFDVDLWLKEHEAHPLVGTRRRLIRNAEWFHMFNGDVISMPDKWEYPWYAAWDLAFHSLALMMVDFDFAKEQLLLMLRSLYSHPNGQIPAYEWNFSDVNPPVHAWATLFLFKMERSLGREDLKFLKTAFHSLMLNFNWWVNRKDPEGRNVFAGGFLGLDNIGVFDRSAPLPTGGYLEQADGTAWMAFYCQVMLEIALILADDDVQYEEHAFTFLQHFIWIAYAMDRIGVHQDEMWDETDGFYYDVLRLPDGSATRLKTRSMVGLLPLCASTIFAPDVIERHPRLGTLIRLFRERHPEVLAQVAPTAEGYIGYGGRRLLSPLSKRRLERVLGYLLDENEFLSPHGIRSVSRYHKDHPFVFHVDGHAHVVSYVPAESDTGMFGGNSNWRGPVWMPVNVLIVRGLLSLYVFYGDDFTVECPTGSGKRMTLFEVAHEITRRLASIFLRDATGRRPLYGGTAKFQDDPHWRDLILFYEYFHGDNGAGLGASHQTGWTGVIAMLLDLFGRTKSEDILQAALGSLLDKVAQRARAA
jgi:Glycosyl hydrolase family 63 C-terminal domain